MHQRDPDPIITSLLDLDFYKPAMGQLIFTHFRDVLVTFKFKCRTKGIPLARIIPESQLREELDHVMTLRYNNSELHYLRGTNEYGERMFREPYLEFLKGYAPPQYKLAYVDDEIHLSVAAPWAESSPWETIMLAIINELYYRQKMKELTSFERDVVYAKGRIKLAEKIATLRKYPGINFSEFGTRRRFSKAWQDYVVETLKNELPDTQFRGTSNVFLAMRHGVLPMGTNAHELPMVLAGIMQRDDDELRQSQHEVMRLWWEMYGEGLSIMLPDTFGSEFVFRTMTRECANKWKGSRQDSGDPTAYGERVITLYGGMGIDPRRKLVVFSDGLEMDSIVNLHLHFVERLMHSFGWGTGLTNDMGFKPLSIVVKAVDANGKPLVKLSDNLGKGMGPDDEQDRYKRAFGYNVGLTQETVY